MVFNIFKEIKNIFKWIFPDYTKPYCISDDLQTQDDLINFDNAVIKSRKERVKVNVSLSNGKIISVKAFS